MDQVLGRLYKCHCSSNTVGQLRGQRHRGQVVVGAAAAPSPLTQSQRALLHTAIQRSRRPKQQEDYREDAPEQQKQRTPHQEVQLRSNLLNLQQLVENAISSTQHASEPLQQEQVRPVASFTPHNPDAEAGTVNMATQGATDQSCPPQQRSPAVSSDTQQQRHQQQLLQQQLQLRHLIQQQQIRQRRLQLQLRSEPAVLTALIKRCRTWQTLQHLFSTYTDHFNPVHVSAAITHLAQLHGPIKPVELQQQPQGLQQLMRDLTAAAASCIPDYGPRQLANTIWAISKLGCGSKISMRLRAEYVNAFRHQLPAAAPQHISNVALAVGSMGWGTSTEWKRDLLAVAKSKQQSFNTQELANLLHALPLLGAHPSRQWLTSFLETCYRSLSYFSSQELSLLGIGLVRLKWQPGQQFMLGYIQAIEQHLVATHDSSSKAVGSSTAQVDTTQQQQRSVRHNSQRRQPAGFQAQGLVNVLWVLTVWGAAPSASWQTSCVAAANCLLGSCTMQGLSTLLWAMTRLQFTSNAQLLARLVQLSQPLLPSATSTDLALLLWSLGTMTCRLQRCSSATGCSGKGLDSSCIIRAAWLQRVLYHSGRILVGASANDLICMLLGVTRMRLHPGTRWLHAVATQAHHLMDSMNSAEVSTLLLCFARLKHKPAESFAASYCSRSSQLLQKTAAALRRRRRQCDLSSIAAADTDVYSPQSLVNTLGAMAMLEYSPPESWSTLFFAASRLLMPAFTAKDFAYCMWALATLDLQPSQRWMDELLVHLRQHIPTMRSSELSAIIWALAKLGHKPGVSWMQRFLDRVTALASTSSDFAQAATIYSTSSHHHSRSLLLSSATNSSTATRMAAQGAASVSVEQMPSEPAVPRTPLQLSADFSSIILHGLTIWATARLDYPNALVISDSKEDSEQSASYVTAAADALDHSGIAEVVTVGSAYSQKSAGAVNMTVSRDGSLLFQF